MLLTNIRILLQVRHPAFSATTVLILWLGWGVSISTQVHLLTSGGHPWSTADWAISYRQGFTRRGLFGTFLDFLESNLGLPLLFLSTLTIVVVLTLVVGGVTFIYLRSSKNLGLSLALVAPLSLNFGAISPGGGGRKELLIFLWFLVVISIDLMRKKTHGNWTPFVLIQMGFALLLLNHEAVLLWFPLILGLSSMCLAKAPRILLKVNGLMLFMQGLTAIIVFNNFQLSESDTYVLCRSLIDEGFSESTCSESAVTWLTKTVEAPIALSTQRLLETDLILSIGSLFITLILPLIYLAPSIRLQKYFLLQTLSLPVVFVISADWGRNLHILFLLIVILRLGESASIEAGIPSTPERSLLQLDQQALRIVGPLFLVFALGWGVTEYGGYNSGLIAQIREVLITAFFALFP